MAAEVDDPDWTFLLQVGQLSIRMAHIMQGAAARRFELQQTSAATSFYTALAGKKLVRFQEFAALYPEAVFVFVGDNGQVTQKPCQCRLASPPCLTAPPCLQEQPGNPRTAGPGNSRPCGQLILIRHGGATGVHTPIRCIKFSLEMAIICRPAQGDVLVSEALATIFARQAERDGSPNRLAACFIHEV